VDENILAIEIRESLQDPEYHAAVRLPELATITWPRSELVDTEADSKALWQKHSFRPSRSTTAPTAAQPLFQQPKDPHAVSPQEQQPQQGRGRNF